MSEEVTAVGSEQPSDLFGYIGSAGFQAVSDDEVVNLLGTDAPVNITDADTPTNVDQAAPSQETTPGVTIPQPEPDDSEALRLQQRVRDLEEREQKTLGAFALLASQARQREEALFNQSLSLMSDEEQEVAKAQREHQRIVNENTYLRQQVNSVQRGQEEIQTNLDKQEVIGKVVARLGLPASDNFVMQALWESESPAEMFAKANRMAKVYAAQRQAADAQVATSVAGTNVYASAGETAPVAPPKRTAERSGELIDMMRERQYTSESSR